MPTRDELKELTGSSSIGPWSAPSPELEPWAGLLTYPLIITAQGEGTIVAQMSVGEWEEWGQLAQHEVDAGQAR